MSILKKQDEFNPISPSDTDRLANERREKRLKMLENYEKEMKKSGQQPTKQELMSVVNTNTNVVQKAPKVVKKHQVDDDSDDMFADDEKNLDNHVSAVKVRSFHDNPKVLDSEIVRNSTNPALIDNWDDSEGYYRVVLGEKINQYHIYANLGKGVFSSVVKAKDSNNNETDFAIKIIRNNDVMYRAGLKEMNILEKLKENDPDDKQYTIRLVSYFEYKSHLCLVFECLNLNLRQVLKKFGRNVGLNLKAVRSYTVQLFLALSLLQSCKVVHADIKPDNILVTENHAILKLADFGSAFDVEEGEITPYLVSRFYRAPEIILGLPYGYSIDVWSVACTLFELFTGKMLFPGRTNNHMLALIMETKGKFPRGLLRKSSFVEQHFTNDLLFLYQDIDKISGNPTLRTLAINTPISPLREKLGLGNSVVGSGDPETEKFADFLDKCLNLIPDKRMSVKEALAHPFVLSS